MGIDIADLFVKPVAGHDDTFAFVFDFIPEGKALDDGTTEQVVTETDDGDLIIEGYAAVFEGNDRQGENFTDGAFQRGIKSFLSGQAALCYHHKHDKCLGKVLELEEVEGKGLRMKARVDGAIKNHPELGTYYQQIKKGTLNALSVGGFFKRKLTPGGWKISDTDMTEISVTPVPVHAGTHFGVLAGKALTADLPEVKLGDLPDDEEVRQEDIDALFWTVDSLNSTIDRIIAAKRKRTTSTGS
jgi:HK97 family phage prohead protease